MALSDISQPFATHPTPMLLVDPDSGAVVDANEAACRFYGWTREELTAKSVLDITTMSHEEMAAEEKRVAALAALVASRLRLRHRLASGEERFVEVHSGPAEVGGRALLYSIIIDETPRVMAELALARRDRLYEMLSQMNQRLIRARERDALLSELCQVAVSFGGFLFAWVGLVDAEGRVVPAARAGEDNEYIDSVRATIHPGDPRSEGPGGQSILTAAPVIVHDLFSDPSMVLWRDNAVMARVRSVAAIPLSEEGRVVGSIFLYSAEQDFVDAAELATLTQMAADVSYGLDMLLSTRRRIAAEAQAAAWNERLERYLEGSPTISYAIEVTPSGRRTEWVTANAERMLGYTIDEMLAPGWWMSRLHPADRSAAVAASAALVADGAGRLEYRVLTADNRAVWVLDNSRFTPNAAGDGGRISGTWTDVTERHEVLERLRESEQRLRLALSAASQGLYDLSLATGEAVVTAEYAVMLGYDPATFRETHAAWRARLHPDDAVRVMAAFAACCDGTLPEYRAEQRQRTREGAWRWILSVGRIVERDAEGRPLRMLGTHTDITELKTAESALQLRSTALEAAADAIVIMDKSGLVEWANRAFTDLTGYELSEAMGQNPRALLRSGLQSLDFFAEMWQEIHSGKVWRGELVNRKKDGTHYPESLTITPVRAESGAVEHFIAIKRDLTEDRLLRESLLQAQKMESVGRLAGGVAHDFNNLLTVIIGSTDLALGQIARDTPLAEDLVEVRHAAERAAALTRQLLAFSRRQILQRHLVDVPQLIGNLMKMLRRLIGEDITLQTELSASSARVLADPGQLEQVVMNLVVNARDAMPDGGTLTLSTTEVELGPRETAGNVEMKPGRFLRLSVHDTGVGMDATVRARLFEPFFTTKSPGQGTGLGLSTVYGFIRQSGGDVRVESTLGVGSVFHVFLPQADTEDEHTSVTTLPIASRVAAATAGQLRGTVLVVDDEPILRNIAVKILTRSGYTAIGAGDATEAIQLFDEHEGAFDLLLTDVVMPGMSGPKLAEALIAKRAGLKVLFASGYTDDTVLRHGVDGSTMEFLGKPYTLEELIVRVEAILRA